MVRVLVVYIYLELCGMRLRLVGNYSIYGLFLYKFLRCVLWYIMIVMKIIIVYLI